MNTTFAHRWPDYLLLLNPINASRRRCHAVSCGALCCVMFGSVSAAEYPLKSVRVIVPLAAAGGTDISARILAKKLSETMGQSFVVDNRPGAGTMLGTEMVAKSAPDGYTLMVISPEFTINPSLQPNVPYDAIKDFAPIIRIVYGQYFLAARSSLSASTVKELIALARAAPGEVRYASSGNGSANHLAGELFKMMAGVDMVHVPYKGSGPAVTALLAGEVQVEFGSTTAILPHIKSGRAKALAVTALQRSPVAPQVPTVAESGLPGFEVTGWYGFMAPARTPVAIINRLNNEVNRVLPDLKDRYAELGTELAGGSSREFAAFIKSEIDKWAKVVKASGAKPD